MDLDLLGAELLLCNSGQGIFIAVIGSLGRTVKNFPFESGK
jgi:hypothetical protein